MAWAGFPPSPSKPGCPWEWAVGSAQWAGKCLGPFWRVAFLGKMRGYHWRRAAFLPTADRPLPTPPMKLIIAIVQPSKLEDVKAALAEVEVVRLTILDVQGFGRQKGHTEQYRGTEISVNLLRKVQLQIAVNEKFGQKDVDMTAQLTRVKAAAPQAVVVWSIPPSASIATRNYADLGLRMPLFQSHGIGNKKFIELAGAAANGVTFPAGKLLVAEQLADNDPQKPVLLAYARDFEAKYGPRNTFGGRLRK